MAVEFAMMANLRPIAAEKINASSMYLFPLLSNAGISRPPLTFRLS